MAGDGRGRPRPVVRDQVLIGHHHKASGVASGDRVEWIDDEDERREGGRWPYLQVVSVLSVLVERKGIQVVSYYQVIYQGEKGQARSWKVLHRISNIELYIYHVKAQRLLVSMLCLTRPEELEGLDQKGHSEFAKRSRTLYGVNSHLHVPDDGTCLTRTFDRLAPFRIVKGYSAAIIPVVQDQNPQAINRRGFSRLLQL